MDPTSVKQGPTWPFDLSRHGGVNGSPDEVRDLAVLVPAPDLLKTSRATKLLVIEVQGLDGSYILSSDGATRPFSAGH